MATKPHEPPKQHCIACRSEFPPGAEICEKCKSWQGVRCVVCRNWLPKDAKRCNACSTYQGGLRKYFPLSERVLALLTALIGVTSPALLVILYFLNNNSHTSLMVTRIEGGIVTTYAWNTGRKPGRLVGATLDFGPYEFKNETLESSDKTKTLIAPGGKAVMVEFTISTTLKKQTKSQKEKAATPVLLVTVQESNDEPDKPRSFRVPLESSMVNRFIEEMKAAVKK